MKLKLLAFALCIGSPLALAVGGRQELIGITGQTKELERKVSNWNGSPFSMFPIGLQAQKLKQVVDAGTVTFQNLEGRMETDDKLIVVAANEALTALDGIMNTVIAARAKFDQIPLGLPILFGILKTLQVSTRKLTQACINGASIANINEFKAMADRANAHFERAMASYE